MNSLLMPIFLYPVLLWVMFTGVTFVQGVNEGFTSRLAMISAIPEAHRSIEDSLLAASGIEFISEDGAVAVEEIPILGHERALALLRDGGVDAVVAFVPPAPEGVGLPDNFRVQVYFDRAENRSVQARGRVEDVVDDYRQRWVTGEAARLGLDAEARMQFAIASTNVSSSEALGARVLGQMLSFFIIIMVALGCFVPSVDTTAGERERSTWETLMTVAASRASVVTAKYLYVATLGIVAGVLNVIALFVSIGAIIRPLIAQQGGTDAIAFNIPLLAVPVMVAGTAALALFFAAAMMILASFARSFKDGQAMVQPVYWLVFLPLLLGQQSDRTLTPAVASIPVANVSMMIRDAINGVFLWPLIAQTLAVTLATVVGCLLVARYVLRFENFLMGSFDGSFWRFAKARFKAGDSR